MSSEYETCAEESVVAICPCCGATFEKFVFYTGKRPAKYICIDCKRIEFDSTMESI